MSTSLEKVSQQQAAAAVKLEAVSSAENLRVAILAAPVPTTPEQEVELIDAAKACKLAWDALEAERTKITKPLDAAKAAVQSATVPRLTALKSAIDRAKDLIKQYRANVAAAEARRKAEADRIAREAEQAQLAKVEEHVAAGGDAEDIEVEPAVVAFVPPTPSVVRGGIGAANDSSTLCVEVVDMAKAAAEFPGCFEFKPGIAKELYRARAKAIGGEPTMPGLRFWFEKGVQIR